MGTTYAARKSSEAETLLRTMSSELQGILAEVDRVTQKSADLQQQIITFEDRQKYVTAALEQSRKIAEDISSRAERRINSVLAYADGIVSPQKQEIEALDLQITAIDGEIGSRAMAEPTLPPDLVVPALDSDCFIPDKIIQLSDYMELPLLSPMSGPAQEDEAQHVVQPAPTITESQADLIIETELSTAEFHDIDLSAKGEFDPRESVESGSLEKQDCSDDLLHDVDFRSVIEPADSITDIEITWVEPEEPQLNLDQLPASECETADLTSAPYSAADSVAENRDCTTETREDVEEPRILFLDTTVNAWHEHSSQTWDQKNHNHNWEIKIQVEIPKDGLPVIQTRLLASIQSTLSRYDGVLLNEVFPFNLIDPTDENVARYFFNCLEDTLMMKDLRLLEISLSEGETYMQVSERHTELEETLKGDDIIERMRANLIAKSQGGEVPADNAGKKRRGFFGRHNSL